MKKWHLTIIASILILVLSMPVSANYPMFHADAQRTGLAAGDGPATDAELWNITIAEWADGSPVVADGRVYVTTWPDMDFSDGDETYLYCLDATTGSEIWKNPLGAGVGSVASPAIADGRIFVGGTDNRLYCIDSADGSTLWSEPVDAYPYFGLSCSPLVDGGRVMVTARSNGTFFAFTPEGTLDWTFATGGAVSQFTSPAADGGYVYFAGNDSALFCVDPAAQTEVWNVTLDGTIKSTPVIGAGTVYVATASTLFALSASEGSEDWSIPLGTSFATPALADGFLYAGASDGLHCIAAATGVESWSFPSAKVDVSPVVANGTVYFATNEETGTLYAVDAAGGSEIWSFTVPSPGGGAFAAFYSSSPAVSDGFLYIGAEDNHFYAFGEAAAPVEPVEIYNGSVTLAEGETFSFVPANNASASYELNRTTDIGALDAAASAGGFTFNASDEWYASYGSFLLEDIDGIANEDWMQPDYKSWALYLNGAAATAGLGANDLADGDTVTFYYCPSDPVTYAALIDQATYVVTIDVTVDDGSVTAVGIWNGTVTLAEGETFSFVPSNNASASYELNRTTDIGALDAAAGAGGFAFNASDEWYASYGSFLLEDIDGIANEDWTEPNAHSWAIYLNGAAATAGLGANDLADGDTLTFYYCPTDPVTYTALIDEATYVVGIGVAVDDGSVTPVEIWNGSVTLAEGDTFSFVPSNNASASYELSRTTDIGALDAAATAGGFTFNASDEWYASFGSFLLEDIDGIANEDWMQPDYKSWALYLNGAPAMAGLGANDLADGDTVTFYYCPSDPVTYEYLIDQATYVVTIDVTVSPVATSGFTVTDASRGGTAEATLTVTADEAGWYAVVVSGVNGGGDSLAGIATVRLEAGNPVEIPVLVAVPQQAQTGVYTLYAGVYTLDGYPDDLICHSEGAECVVS